MPVSDIAQTPSNPLMSILASIISPTPSPQGHGETTQERAIYEIDENKTKTEDELS